MLPRLCGLKTGAPRHSDLPFRANKDIIFQARCANRVDPNSIVQATTLPSRQLRAMLYNTAPTGTTCEWGFIKIHQFYIRQDILFFRPCHYRPYRQLVIYRFNVYVVYIISKSLCHSTLFIPFVFHDSKARTYGRYVRRRAIKDVIFGVLNFDVSSAAANPRRIKKLPTPIVRTQWHGLIYLFNRNQESMDLLNQ